MRYYDKMLTLRLTDQIWSDLKAIAENEESSVADVVRTLIVDRIDEEAQTPVAI
jgi:predicted DNA-binding ribbon-helix-helix protein